MNWIVKPFIKEWVVVNVTTAAVHGYYTEYIEASEVCRQLNQKGFVELQEVIHDPEQDLYSDLWEEPDE